MRRSVLVLLVTGGVDLALGGWLFARLGPYDWIALTIGGTLGALGALALAAGAVVHAVGTLGAPRVPEARTRIRRTGGAALLLAVAATAVGLTFTEWAWWRDPAVLVPLVALGAAGWWLAAPPRA